MAWLLAVLLVLCVGRAIECHDHHGHKNQRSAQHSLSVAPDQLISLGVLFEHVSTHGSRLYGSRSASRTFLANYMHSLYHTARLADRGVDAARVDLPSYAQLPSLLQQSGACPALSSRQAGRLNRVYPEFHQLDSIGASFSPARIVQQLTDKGMHAASVTAAVFNSVSHNCSFVNGRAEREAQHWMTHYLTQLLQQLTTTASTDEPTPVHLPELVTQAVVDQADVSLDAQGWLALLEVRAWLSNVNANATTSTTASTTTTSTTEKPMRLSLESYYGYSVVGSRAANASAPF